jgi:DNA-binding MarR family transcriptional regulator
MLEDVLRIVASEGTASSAGLARRLGVSRALAEHMLEELARHGYLNAVAGECAAPCERCPLRSACLFGRRGRIWSLSPKGRRLLTRRNAGANAAATST